MVTLVKHEWHQVDSQFAVEIDEDKLREIYEDLDDEGIAAKLRELESGELSIEQLVDDADEAGVDIEWDKQYDDWWTDRKGGYDVTYELGDASSWHQEPPPSPPTKKCTLCRWEGHAYSATTVYVDKQGQVGDFDGQNFVDSKDICPMCDSDLLNINPSHQCTACTWVGQYMDTDTVFDTESDEKHRAEGNYCPGCGAPVTEVAEA